MGHNKKEAATRKGLRWWVPFVSGASGDMTATLFTHPMDVIKVQLQLTGELSTKKRLSAADLSRVASTAAKNGLYRGLSAALLRQSIFATTRHGLYYHINRGLRESGFARLLGGMQTIVAAAFAGVIGAVCANPADVVLVRMQADPHWPREQQRGYRNAFHGLYSIIRSEGYQRLWRGCIPTVIRAVMVTASQIPSYHLAKHCLVQYSPMRSGDVQTHLAAGSVSAICASVATNPVDVIKTRIINMKKHGGAAHYSGPIDCFARTLATEGVGGFYKGLGATVARLLPHTLILWVVQEKVISVLG